MDIYKVKVYVVKRTGQQLELGYYYTERLRERKGKTARNKSMYLET